MNDYRVNTFPVSEKISKIRWEPVKSKESDVFVTASYDMQQNYIRFYRLEKNDYPDEHNEYTANLVNDMEHACSITGMEFMDDFLVISDNESRVTLLGRDKKKEDKICVRTPSLHKFRDGSPAPCTGISIHNNDIASIGEDGRLVMFHAELEQHSFRSIEADSISLTAVAYVNRSEVLTANRMGIVRIFDIRLPNDEAEVNKFEIPTHNDKQSTYVSSFTSYPTQSHIILAGTEDGTISVFDLRDISRPASYLSAHKGPITEMGFHHAHPTKFYSAAEDGELWMWTEKPTLSVPDTKAEQANANVNPWLNGERTKNNMSFNVLISNSNKAINSFDARGSKVICAGDSESVYLINNVL